VKSKPCAVDATTLATSITLTTAPRSAMESLHTTLRTVYVPALAAAGATDGKLRDTLAALETSLGAALRRGDGREGASGAGGGGGVASLADEVAYWLQVATEGRTSRERDRAALFARALRPLADAVAALPGLPLTAAAALPADAQGALEATWSAKLPTSDKFPAPRMHNVFALIAAALAQRISAHGEREDVWTSPAARAVGGLRTCVRIVEGWQGAVDTLTGSLWAASAGIDNPWPSSLKPDTAALAAVGRRVDEVLRLRTTLDQYHQLLAAAGDDAGVATLSQVVRPLTTANPLSLSAFSQHEWSTTVAGLEAGLERLDAAAVSCLKRHVSALTPTPHLLTPEVSRFVAVVSRPAVLRGLVAEREAVLAQLTAEVRRARGLHVGGGGGGEKGRARAALRACESHICTNPPPSFPPHRRRSVTR